MSTVVVVFGETALSGPGPPQSWGF